MGTVLRADNHFKSTHGGVDVRYECGACHKSSHNFHSISCHVPKCRGPEASSRGGTTPAVRCEVCGRGFKSALAVSIHENHVHPDIRNMKHIRQAQMNKGSTRKWTEQEVALLNQLVMEFDGEPEVVLQVAERFPNRSREAIRSKIRQLGHLAQNTVQGGVAEPDLTTWLLSPRQSTAICTGLRECLAQLAESHVGPPACWWPAERSSCPTTGNQEAAIGITATPTAVCQGPFGPGRPDDQSAVRCPLPLEDLEGTFRQKWEKHGSYMGLGHFVVASAADNEHFMKPITSREILDTLKSIRADTALGPDRIGKRALLNWDPNGLKLERILNTWWFTGVIPQCLKRCRTVLLPKSKDESLLADVHNWRPITIRSGILKLYSRILTARLAEACPLHDRQRGFIHAPGCAENVEILRCVMRRSGIDKRALAVVFVDFAKAFDSVLHEHILDVLRQRQVDDHVIRVIRDMYTNVISRVEDGRGGATPEIPIQVSVKQGDPMSPLLFNLALDPLIRTLCELGKGYHLSGRMLVTLAFADDLALVSDGWDGMAHNLKILDAFCKLTRLRVQPRKCYGFLRKPTADSFTLNDCQAWMVGGSPLNMIGPDESERYLGIRVNPMRGVMKPELQVQYEDWVGRIGRAPLRPHQKLVILRGYAIPRLIYQADLGELGVLALRALDGTTRKAVKKWLHLPLCTTDGLLFVGLKDGGLGLQKLECMVPSIQVRCLHQLASSTDELTSALICDDPHMVAKFQNLWRRAGG
ncbi:hypothetical protein MHYP_G00216540 [Metynnis hypsauchen]